MMRKAELIEKVRQAGREYELWKPDDKILVAVSGGPDSLALLLVLQILSETEGFSVGCCTVNHHLRSEAEAEVDFVNRVCRERGIPFFTKDIDVLGAIKSSGSLETVARELRYEALREIKKINCYDSIAVAHHGDDQVETLLFRLIKGSGITGLSGMQRRNGDIIRPFLSLRKKELEEFLREFPYTPCHDKTNDVPDADRNKIRLNLIPMLQTYNSKVAEALIRTADILQEDDAYMLAEVKKFLQRNGKQEGENYLLNKEIFYQVMPALQRRMIRYIIFHISKRIPSYDGVERCISFIKHGGTGKKISTAGCLLYMSYGSVIFQKGDTHFGIKSDNNVNLMSFEYTHDAKADIIHDMFVGDTSWVLHKEILAKPPERLGKNQLLLDADQVGTLGIRYVKTGDRFSAKGIKGSKKVNRVMSDLHIPIAQRNTWPLVADENHIYWIAFLRVSRFALPNDGTTRFLLLTLKKECR